jgi:hypothetical protein
MRAVIHRRNQVPAFFVCIATSYELPQVIASCRKPFCNVMPPDFLKVINFDSNFNFNFNSDHALTLSFFLMACPVADTKQFMQTKRMPRASQWQGWSSFAELACFFALHGLL